VWQGITGGQEVIQAAARRASSGAWSAPQNLVVGGAHTRAPQVALDAAGSGVAIWERRTGGHQVIQAAARPASSGAWSAPQTLSPASLESDYPDVALNRAGDAVVVWDLGSYEGSDGYTIQAAVRPASSGVWSAPHNLTAGGVPTGAPEVSLDAAGNAVAVWERLSGGHQVIQAAVRPAASGAWIAPKNLSPGGTGSDYPEVALDPAGDAIVVWDLGSYEGSDGYPIQAAVRPASSGVWSAPHNLPIGGGAPEVALDPTGNAVVVSASAIAGYRSIWAVGYDAAGPVVSGLKIPSKGRAGAKLRFSVSPFDVWSAIAGSPEWSFGDGKSAHGTKVVHRYGKAGRYTVFVSQADVLGNRTNKSGKVVVSPFCLVPDLVGKTLSRAKAALKKAHCRVGKLKRAYSERIERGRVLSQSPKPRRKLANSAKVNLVV
jgi:PASTA domain/PKD domain